jgi:PAS domain S-box-containing protein
VEFDDGTIRTITGNAVPLLDGDRRPYGSVASLTDVTESRWMEGTLRENEQRFRSLFDQLPLGAALVSPDFRFLELNKAYCDIMGYSREELMSLTFVDITHPEDLDADLAQAKQLLDGKIDQYEMEKRFLRKDGGIVWARLIVGGIRDERRRLVNFLATLEDITRKRATEEALHESEARFRTSLETLPECFAIFRATRDGKGRTTDLRCDYLNDAACRMAGLSREETVGRNLVEMFPPLRNSELLKNLLITLNRKEPLIRSDVEFPDDFAIEGFSARAFDIRAARLEDGLAVAWTDVTERRELAEALRRLLGEKDNLLRELSHRTKNNMQVIESLLGLQAAKSGDARLARMLGEARNRIRAMALVHEKLFKSGSVASLSMKDYIRDLVSSLLDAQQEVPGRVRPVLELEDISLSLDAAVPCGLIINELVSNSLKHAFGEKKVGTIFLSLHRTAGEVELRYGDDGPGLPGNLELFQVESLGLKLVYSMAVRQLRGRVELLSEPRSAFMFRFLDLDIAKRL